MFLKLIYKDQTKKINLSEDLKDIEKLRVLIRGIKNWNVSDFTLSFIDPEDEIVEIIDNHDMDYFLALSAHQKFGTIVITEAVVLEKKDSINDQDFIDMSRNRTLLVDIPLNNLEIKEERNEENKMGQLIAEINDLIIDGNMQTENLIIVDQGVSAQVENEDKYVNAVVESKDISVGEVYDPHILYRLLHSNIEKNTESLEKQPEIVEEAKDHNKTGKADKVQCKNEKKAEKLKRKMKKIKDKLKKQEEKLMSFVNDKLSTMQSQINNLSMTSSKVSDTPEQKTTRVPPTVNCMTVHTGVTCDNCHVYPIVGKRFKCMTCPDFDLCEKCEQQCIHNHPMIRMMSAANGNAFSRGGQFFRNIIDSIKSHKFHKNQEPNNETGKCRRFRRCRLEKAENCKEQPIKDDKNSEIKEEVPFSNDNRTECAQRRKEKSELLDFIFGNGKDEEAKNELLNRYYYMNIEDFYMIITSSLGSL